MLNILLSRQFKRDLKSARKRGFDLTELSPIVNMLAEQKTLAPKYHDHKLSGNYDGFRECHIKPDWLLIYRIDEDELELFLFRTGTHSDLF
ncbi:MAG: type II toxin-antitoxin system YafQ family toxin [Lachnospiraceae bacterium]